MSMSISQYHEQPQAGTVYRAGIAVLGLLLLGSLVLWQMSKQMPKTWHAPADVSLQIGDAYYQLRPEQLGWIGSYSEAFFESEQARASEIVNAQIAAQLDSTFAAVSARLPQFADWYYSLPGEYSRIAMAVLSAARLADGDFVARRAAEQLFPDPVWRATLTQLDHNAAHLLQEHHANANAQWLQNIQALLARQRVPPPPANFAPDEIDPDVVVLDTLILRLNALDAIQQLDFRMAVSSATAAGVAGPALWRAIVARHSLGAARAAATASAARGSSRMGSAAAAAALCAPGGPVAIACAAVAGAATWAVADWLLLRLDEARNRDELLANLEDSLVQLRAALEQTLAQAYAERLALWRQSTVMEISNSFSPLAGLTEPAQAARQDLLFTE
jgi:hypothetical protein